MGAVKRAGLSSLTNKREPIQRNCQGIKDEPWPKGVLVGMLFIVFYKVLYCVSHFAPTGVKITAYCVVYCCRCFTRVHLLFSLSIVLCTLFPMCAHIRLFVCVCVCVCVRAFACARMCVCAAPEIETLIVLQDNHAQQERGELLPEV